MYTNTVLLRISTTIKPAVSRDVGVLSAEQRCSMS